MAGGSVPPVAILIDDIGYRIDADLTALGLAGDYSYAILPHTPHGARFARAAQALARDSLLHLPMEAERGNAMLGPDALRRGMSANEIGETLAAALTSLPGIIGLNNHMGSRLTADVTAMEALAASVARHRGLFFVDSRTTPLTVAAPSMRARGIATLERDVFLDNVRRPRAIRRQLAALVARAKRHGRALGIAHPYRETIAVLRAWQPSADEVRLVPVSKLFDTAPALRPVVATDCGNAPRGG